MLSRLRSRSCRVAEANETQPRPMEETGLVTNGDVYLQGEVMREQYIRSVRLFIPSQFPRFPGFPSTPGCSSCRPTPNMNKSRPRTQSVFPYATPALLVLAPVTMLPRSREEKCGVTRSSYGTALRGSTQTVSPLTVNLSAVTTVGGGGRGAVRQEQRLYPSAPATFRLSQRPSIGMTFYDVADLNSVLSFFAHKQPCHASFVGSLPTRSNWCPIMGLPLCNSIHMLTYVPLFASGVTGWPRFTVPRLPSSSMHGIPCPSRWYQPSVHGDLTPYSNPERKRGTHVSDPKQTRFIESI